MNIVEGLIRKLWENLLGIELPAKFDVMTYDDAMAAYGSDKPDIRLGMKVGIH